MPMGLELFHQKNQCPVRNVLDRFGDKWSVLVLLILAEKRMRFNQLQQTIGEISQKMLSSTLKQLEADGLVNREVYAEVPPRVEYSLTERGYDLIPFLHGLSQWAHQNMEGILESRAAYQQRSQQRNGGLP